MRQLGSLSLVLAAALFGDAHAATVLHRIGGASDEAATAATTSRDGNPVFAFSYAGMPVVDANGTTLPAAGDTRDAGLVRYDGATGRALQAIRLGGAGDQRIRALAEDAQRNLVVAGGIRGADGLETPWLVRVRPDGTVATTRLGEPPALAINHWQDVAVDDAGNVYAVGQAGDTQLFVASYTPDFAQRWRFTIGDANGTAVAGSIALSGTTVVVHGTFGRTIDLRGTAAPTQASLATAGGNATSTDLFAAAFRATDGARTSHALYGKDRIDASRPGALAVDAQGRFYLGARVDASPLEPFFPRGSCTTVNNAGLVVMRLSPDLSCDGIWSLPSGGAEDAITQLVANADGIHFAGWFNGSTDFDPSTTQFRVALNNATGRDAFVAKLLSDGRFDFVAPFGDPTPHANLNLAHALAVDAYGNLWTGGEFRGTVDFDPLVGALPRTSAGGGDAFVVRTSGCGSLTADPQLCRLGVANGVGGSYVESLRDGEGFVIEMLGDGRAGMYWYTFPPEGSPARQMWIVGSGRVLHDRLEFDGFTASGPAFGAGYDPARLAIAPWGRIVVRPSDCNNARLTFSGPAGFGSGTRTLQRLTGIDGHSCDGRASRFYESSGGPGRGTSGSYYELATAGQGFSVHALPDGGMAISFYTFDLDGTPMWLVGAGMFDGRRAVFNDLVRARGTVFTPFNGFNVTRASWGGAVIDFLDCNRARGTFQGDPPYGTDVLDAVRLGSIDGLPCPDPENPD